jgi:hypothetical protein
VPEVTDPGSDANNFRIQRRFWAADYRGDEPVLGEGLSVTEFHCDPDFTSCLLNESATLTIDSVEIPLSDAVDASCTAPQTHAVDALYRAILYLDLRAALPVIITRRSSLTGTYVCDYLSCPFVHTPTWIIDGTERDLGVSSEGSLVGACAQALTATTDADGHVTLDWPESNASRLWPDADLNALTGMSGPVGLL